MLQTAADITASVHKFETILHQFKRDNLNEVCLLYTSATTMIFPGHGPYTNVKNELLTNPFIS